MEEIKPIGKVALIELAPQYANVVTPDEKYKTTTTGIVVEVGDSEYGYLKGKRVFWEEYKDGTKTKVGEREFAFVLLDDIRGYING